MSDHDKIYSTKFQDKIERSTVLMFVMTAIAVAIGGIVEIVPLFYLTTMTHLSPDVKGKVGGNPPIWQRQPGQSLDDWKPAMACARAAELAGRDVTSAKAATCAIRNDPPVPRREGSLWALPVSSESMYDHPLRGSKRTGPDLACRRQILGRVARRHLKYPKWCLSLSCPTMSSRKAK
jgi:cytochrome c oxidase cbb3-type subunit 2